MKGLLKNLTENRVLVDSLLKRCEAAYSTNNVASSNVPVGTSNQQLVSAKLFQLHDELLAASQKLTELGFEGEDDKLRASSTDKTLKRKASQLETLGGEDSNGEGDKAVDTHEVELTLATTAENTSGKVDRRALLAQLQDGVT